MSNRDKCPMCRTVVLEIPTPIGIAADVSGMNEDDILNLNADINTVESVQRRSTVDSGRQIQQGTSYASLQLLLTRSMRKSRTVSDGIFSADKIRQQVFLGQCYASQLLATAYHVVDTCTTAQ